MGRRFRSPAAKCWISWDSELQGFRGGLVTQKPLHSVRIPESCASYNNMVDRAGGILVRAVQHCQNKSFD